MNNIKTEQIILDCALMSSTLLQTIWNELVNIKQQEKQIIDPYKHASKA